MPRHTFVTALALAATALSAQGQSKPVAPPLGAAQSAVLRAELLSPEQTQGDLRLVDRAFRQLHPALFRYNTEAGWSARIDSLMGWFAVPRTRGETYLALSRLTASLRCSHTYLSFWNQPAPVHAWLTDAADKLPFEYDLVAGDQWEVTRSATFMEGVPGADSLVLPGDTIVSVNGVRVPDLVRSLLPFVRGDGANDGKRRGLLDFRHRKQFEAIDVFLPLLHPPIDGRYAIVRRRGGRTIAVSVAALPSATRRVQARPVPPVRPMHEVTREGAVAILRVDAFDYGRESHKWAPFVTETFRALNRDSVRTLILDLRENEGGSDEGAEFLLRHLLRQSIALPPLRRYVAYDTVAASLRPALSTWDRSFYDRRGRVTPRGDGTFDLEEAGDWPARIARADDAFAGRVLVLTSAVNSSASHIMLRLLARQPGVTLIGDETGGSLRAHTGGNLFFMTLPGTGFEIDLPLVAYEWGAGQPSGGVQPDVAVPAREAMDRARAIARGASR